MSRSEKFSPDNYDAFISYRHDTGFYIAHLGFFRLFFTTPFCYTG